MIIASQVSCKTLEKSWNNMPKKLSKRKKSTQSTTIPLMVMIMYLSLLQYMQIRFLLSTFLDFFTMNFRTFVPTKMQLSEKKITTVNSFFHYDDIRLLYERIQYLQLHNTFFSINHCWVVNNMDAGKISICNNWIRKWSGAEETIFDLAIFLCIRRRYSLLLSHACIIHIRLLNNGEWSD